MSLEEVPYVSLRTKTTFSIGQALGYPEDIVRQAKELGHEAVCLAESSNTSSHPKLEVACHQHGVKPLYGVVLNTVDRHEDKDRSKGNMLVVALSLDGYQNLLALTNMAYDPEHFYYVPTVSYEEVAKHSAGLAVLTGTALAGDIDAAEERLELLRAGIEHLWVEVDATASHMDQRQAAALGRGAGVPPVVTNDVRYPKAGQEKVVEFLAGIKRHGKGQTWVPSKLSRMVSGGELFEAGFGARVIAESAAIANKADTFELPAAASLEYAADDAWEHLLQWCREGWKSRGISGTPEYRERVLRELGLIKDKGFTDYFLIVADLVRWAKNQGILVGPARGSAAGSLVAYLLGITEVEPIKWGLLFERFIDVSRFDMPDIDIDFQDDRREEVRDYLRAHYGAEHVSTVAGYSLLKGRSLLDDIGRVHKLPKAAVEDAKSDLLGNGGSSSVAEVLGVHWPHLEPLAQAEGMIRHLTVHAAGAVVSSEPMAQLTTVGREGLMLDKRDIEKIGLMKIDMLSLRTLTIIDRCLKVIGRDSSWLYNDVPLDDPTTLEAFSGERFAGVFQFEGAATKRISQRVKPSHFMELIDINALSRPGPLSSGATQAYIDRVQEDIHPVVTRVAERSRGQILFQEQVMQVLREAGGLDWADVTAVRKLITKNEGQDKLEGIRQRFVGNFDDPELGQEVWSRIGESGSYGFNVAHSTSYTFLAYFCMYLKCHYPLQFYWANMVVEPDNELMLAEYIRAGGLVYPVRAGLSGASWTIDSEGLRAGYLTLRGVGAKTAAKLEDGWKPSGKTLERLTEEGVFDDDDGPVDYLGLDRVEKAMSAIPDRDKIGSLAEGGRARIGGRVSNIAVKDLREVLANQGRDYDSEVSDGHMNKYVHLTVSDESGDVQVSVSRYKYARARTARIVDGLEAGDMVIVSGKYSDQYRRLYADQIERIYK